MGTVDNIFVLHGLIQHFINKNKKLYCAFIDFSKAFDFLVRDVIWYKLLKYGVREKMLDIIKSIYSNVKSRVKFENELSETFTCSLGVRQGESMSPFLFSMYLNDIEEHFILNGFEGIEIGMLKLFLLLYADDIVLLAETEQGLQKGLDLLEQYCDKWKLTVNINKTKIMVFRKGGLLRKNLMFKYKYENIDIVSKFTYLGVVFTSGGSFSRTHDCLSDKALKAIFQLKKIHI